MRLYSSLIPEDFDSGYEYVYARIKELERYVAENESSDELNSVNTYMVRDSLDDINEELSDLYDSAILYDDYIGRIRMNLMTMIMFWISTTPTNRTTATTVVMIGIGSTAIMIGMTMMTGPIMIMTGRPTMIITNGELP